jgi:hypothetical protein
MDCSVVTAKLTQLSISFPRACVLLNAQHLNLQPTLHSIQNSLMTTTLNVINAGSINSTEPTHAAPATITESLDAALAQQDSS